MHRAMIIGALQFELAIHDAESLKDKRRVVKSLKDRLHREHLVSVAEIGALDAPARAILGLAVVSNDGKHVAGVLDRVQSKLHALNDAELVACDRQLLRGEELAASASPADTPGIDDPELAAELLRRAGEDDL
jgi:uncharacterized protein YlxP (DUF503 family)